MDMAQRGETELSCDGRYIYVKSNLVCYQHLAAQSEQKGTSVLHVEDTAPHLAANLLLALNRPPK